MKKCPNCGKRAKSNFCPHCGYDLLPIVTEREELYSNTTVSRSKKKKRIGLSIIVVIVLSVIGITILIGMTNRGDKDTTNYNAVYEWPESGLAKSVPKPTLENGEINNNNDTMFDFYLYKASFDDYGSYVNACKEYGYNDVDKESDANYQAYNDEFNRHVDVEYYEDDRKIYVVIRAPENWTNIYWPKSKLASTLPVPDKLYGIINWDESDDLDVDIADISMDEFNAYIDDCIDAGYDVDYSRYDDSFSAENSQGIELDIRYEYFHVMNIDVDVPEGVTISEIEDSEKQISDDENEVSPPNSSEEDYDRETSEQITSYIEDGKLTISTGAFASRFDESVMNNYQFSSKCTYSDTMLFSDENNTVFYEIQNEEDNYKTIGMYSFSKGNDVSIPISENYTSGIATGINFLIEDSWDVSAVVYAAVQAIDPALSYAEATDLSQNIVDNVGNMKGLKKNNIKYTLYMEDGSRYHYLLVTFL